MPTARRVLAAVGLFAAVVAAGTPALAAPGTHGHGSNHAGTHGHGKAIRPAMVNPSANAAEHAHQGKPAKSHPAHPAHPGHAASAKHATKSTSTSVRSASTAAGSSGRTGKGHNARKNAAGLATGSDTDNGRHLAKGAKNGANPAKTAPGQTKAAGQPAKGAGHAATKPGAAKTPTPGKSSTSGKSTITPPAGADFGDTVPLATSPATAVRPVKHVVPAKPRAHSHRSSTSTDAGPPTIPPVLNPASGPLGDLGRQLTRITGIGLFSGPQGWVFTGMLLMALVMMVGAFALGRRPRSVR